MSIGLYDLWLSIGHFAAVHKPVRGLHISIRLFTPGSLNCESGASAFSRAHRLDIRNAACLFMITAIDDTIDFTDIAIKDDSYHRIWIQYRFPYHTKQHHLEYYTMSHTRHNSQCCASRTNCPKCDNHLRNCLAYRYLPDMKEIVNY